LKKLCKTIPPEDSLEKLAKDVRYLGSQEHKSYPSPAGKPALKSDSARCAIFQDFTPLTAALQEAIRRGAISESFEHGFPKYVWGAFQGDIYEARHLSTPKGAYKGYKIEASEYPDGLDERLGA
jgi:hypothetical protein